MGKGTQFAMAFEPWVREWSEAGISSTQMSVMLLLIARMQSDGDGRFTTWRSRVEMADVLGKSEKTVRNAVQALKRKGFLLPIGKSFNGKAQQYVVMPTGKGYPHRTPIRVKGCAVEGRKGVPKRAERVPRTAHPLIQSDGASASSSQPSAREIYRNRDGSINPVL